MFYLLISISLSVIILIIFNIYFGKLNQPKEKKTFHYYILVKNGQDVIEWVIRSINYRRFFKNNIKVTVFDLNSDDDTNLILEKFASKTSMVDNFYRYETSKLSEISDMINSNSETEKAIIIYLNTNLAFRLNSSRDLSKSGKTPSE